MSDDVRQAVSKYLAVHDEEGPRNEAWHRRAADAREAMRAALASGERGEYERNAAWWELCVARSEWFRNDGRTHLAVRVHDGADLSCRAMREDAMIRSLAAPAENDAGRGE